MAFQKYNSANNARALLLLPITEDSETLVLKGAFATLPESNFIVCVTQYNGSIPLFRENMLISTRVWNTCNIQQRKFEFVPENDEVIISIQEKFPFAENSVVECVNSSAFNKDIQEELTRLEEDKLDISWGTRTGLTTNSIVWTDETGVESFLEFDRVADNGKAFIIDETEGLKLESPGVNIEWLTPTISLTPTDKFIVSTSEGNKSIEVSDALRATYQKFTCGEAITKWDLVVQDTTDEKIYRWAWSLTDKIIMWFAQDDWILDDEILVAINGVDNNQTGLSVWEDYYPDDFNIVDIDYAWLNSAELFWYSSVQKLRQPFVTTTEKYLQSISLRVSWSGNVPNDSIKIEIRKQSDFSIVWESEPILWSSLSSTLTNRVFDFWILQLEESTWYYMVFVRTWALSSFNYYWVSYGTSSYPAWASDRFNWTIWSTTTNTVIEHDIVIWSIEEWAISPTPNEFWIIGTWISASEIIFQKKEIIKSKWVAIVISGTWSQTITHWLWRIPKLIKLTMMRNNAQVSHWYWDWVTQSCVWGNQTSTWGVDATKIMNYTNTYFYEVTSVDQTTLTINKTWSNPWNLNILITFE